MKLSQFIKIARGINDGENLPEEELNGFYARVTKSPLAMKEAERAKRNLVEQ
jgi:brefeldin A-inhibited guanine nucleotide-exchange protein